MSGGSSAPSVPTGLAATNALQSVALDWDDTAGATTYDVRRSPGGAGTWTTIATLVAVSNYTDSTTAANTAYDYEVRAVNASGNSDWTASVSGEQTALLIDHFTGTNGTALSAHTMDLGSGWTILSGTPQISGNKMAGTSNTDNLAVAEANSADVTIAVSYVHQTNTLPLLMFRRVDGTNYWIVYFLSGTWTLQEHDNSGYTTRATGADTLTAGNTYSLSLVLAGASIALSRDGSQVVAYGSAASGLSATKHGPDLGANGSAPSGNFDDFQVTR